MVRQKAKKSGSWLNAWPRMRVFSASPLAAQISDSRVASAVSTVTSRWARALMRWAVSLPSARYSAASRSRSVFIRR